MDVEPPESAMAQIAYVPGVKGEQPVVLVPTERPSSQLIVLPLGWQLEPVQCDLQVPEAEGTCL